MITLDKYIQPSNPEIGFWTINHQIVGGNIIAYTEKSIFKHFNQMIYLLVAFIDLQY